MQVPGRVARAVVLLWGHSAVPSEAAAILLRKLLAVLDLVGSACGCISQQCATQGLQDEASTVPCNRGGLAKQLMQSGLLKLLPQVLTQAAGQLQAACNTTGDDSDGSLDLQGLADSFAAVHLCVMHVSSLWPGAAGASVMDLWQATLHWVAEAVQYTWLYMRLNKAATTAGPQEQSATIHVLAQ